MLGNWIDVNKLLTMYFVNTHLEVIQHTSTIHQHITPILKFPNLVVWKMLSQLDHPLAGMFLPVTSHDLDVKLHVLLQVEGFAHFVEVCPDIWSE